MRYGIVENHKFVLIDENLKRLKNTLPFMPQYSVDMVETYPDDEVEQGFDGNWYEKGHAPQKPLEEARAEKLAELNTAFTTAAETAHCTSSAGFEINADKTAARNISNLIVALEETDRETVHFCAYDNTFHTVNLPQLKTMRLEVIDHAEALYQMKWGLRNRIYAAETPGALDAIVITFEPEPDITGGQSATEASCNTDTPVTFIEQSNQSIYGEVNDEQTV